MTKQQADKIASLLKKQFKAKVEYEKLVGSKEYRFAVVSTQFEKMSPLGRQDAVWAVVDSEIPREIVIDISLIITYSPKELATV